MGSGNLPEGVKLKLKYEVCMGNKWIIGEGEDFRNSICENPEDRKHSMLIELKRGVCSWCRDRRKKGIVALTTDKSYFL